MLFLTFWWVVSISVFEPRRVKLAKPTVTVLRDLNPQPRPSRPLNETVDRIMRREISLAEGARELNFQHPNDFKKGEAMTDHGKQVLNYIGVAFDRRIMFAQPIGEPKHFRIIAYKGDLFDGVARLNNNGVAVIDDEGNIICEKIGACASGVLGVSLGQIQISRDMCLLKWREFKDFVNNHPFNRIPIE